MFKTDIEEHGPTPKCPGCRALGNAGKYRAKHTDECRIRFEKILSETEAGKKRIEAARERRLDGITKKAMEFENKIEAPKDITVEDPHVPPSKVVLFCVGTEAPSSKRKLRRAQG